MKTRHYTEEEIILALIRNAGLVSYAAKSIGCDSSTIYRAIKKSPSVQEAYNITKETNLDLAENVVVAAMKGGNTKDALGAATFMLRYKGQERGYIKTAKVSITEELSKLMQSADERMNTGIQ